ncbi:MAG TPA: Rv3235 family protein [Mycobacterium sp.]|jgi:hypothetical protein
MSHDLTVVPVADYEPPVGEPRRPPPTFGRPVRRLAAVPPLPEQPSARAAAVFADAALRGVLEVVDGRRPFAQLQPLLGDGLADTVIALVRSSRAQADALRASGSSPGMLAAQLRRVRLRIVDRDGDVAEVFATYYRDGRVRAIAGRVQRAEIRGRRGWRLVALQMG